MNVLLRRPGGVLTAFTSAGSVDIDNKIIQSRAFGGEFLLSPYFVSFVESFGGDSKH